MTSETLDTAGAVVTVVQMEAVAPGVIDVLVQRARGRTDDHRVGLVVEGGGMLGVVNAAMLCALDELGLAGCFDASYGVSVGAWNLVWWRAGYRWEVITSFLDDAADSEWISVSRRARGGPLADVGHALDVAWSALPVQTQSLAGAPLIAGVANLDTLGTDVVDLAEVDEVELRAVLRATATIPYFAGPPVALPGRAGRYLDGCTFLPTAAQLAVDDGCTHVLCIEPVAGRPRLLTSRAERFAARQLDELAAGAGAAMLASRALGRSERPVDLGPRRLVEIAPRAGSHRATAASRDPWALLGAAREGYRAAFAVLGPALGRTERAEGLPRIRLLPPV